VNLYLAVRDDCVVTSAYISDTKASDNDVLYVEAYEGVASIEEVMSDLDIVDRDGKYNHKYDHAFMRMTQDEKARANKTDMEAALEILSATDYQIIKAIEQVLEATTNDEELLRIIAERKQAREVLS
jgi:hypothetical protein